tara:strand:- start:174 stop:365 length:192 start_codon:yes stop_codon:yes gene_type:complete
MKTYKVARIEEFEATIKAKDIDDLLSLYSQGIVDEEMKELKVNAIKYIIEDENGNVIDEWKVE